MRVLFVASECAPFAKAGGLGDVVGALPKALARLGHDVRVLLPRYDTVRLDQAWRHDQGLAVPLGGGEAWCAVVETRLPGSDVPVYLLEHDALYGRGYLYDPPGGLCGDNLARFGLLCRGAFSLCRHLRWEPEIFHLHDWPSALVAVMLNHLAPSDPLAGAASVLTIHNLAHQPRFAASGLALLRLPREVFRADGLEDHGALSPFKGGLWHATKLTTVSPRYADEVRRPEHGCGLDGLLRFRAGDLLGILNGIDDAVWDPANDPHLPARYSASDLTGKHACKRALQRELRLAERDDVPLFGVVSRMGEQKGTDVLVDALDALLSLGQVALLGSGDPEAEAYFARRSHQGGDHFRAFIGYSEPLAHRIEAGCDLFLMPSRFEPCGLNQLYSMRYGSPPIVRATGGLDDTVEQCDPDGGGGTGFKLWDLSPRSLYETARWATGVWRDRKEAFSAMQQRGMRRDYGWGSRARQYGELYAWAKEARNG